MMQMHMKLPRGQALAFDPLAEAFRTGQDVYRRGLLMFVNQRRELLDKRPVDWPAVGATPHAEVWRRGAARLLKYDAIASKAGRQPILLVCSLINRPYVLDLLPGRSVIARLRESGRDVYLLDWGRPTPADRDSGLAHYALELLPEAARAALGDAAAERLHVIGYCMGGTFALLAAAAGRLPLAGLIAMATPVDLHDSGLLSLWCRAPGFDPEEIVRIHGEAPPHLLQPAFKMLDPIGLATKLAHLGDKLADDDFVRFFLAMESWLEDSVSFPGRAFVEWVELYRNNALVAGLRALGGHRLDFQRLTTPVLSLVAETDYITPPSSSRAIARVLPNAAHREIALAGGHIGLATSSAAHRTLWPAVNAWLAEVEDRLHPAAAAGKASKTGKPRKGPKTAKAHKARRAAR